MNSSMQIQHHGLDQFRESKLADAVAATIALAGFAFCVVQFWIITGP